MSVAPLLPLERPWPGLSLEAELRRLFREDVQIQALVRQLAREAVVALAVQRAKGLPGGRTLEIDGDMVVDAAARVFGVTARSMRSSSKVRRVADARAVACWPLRRTEPRPSFTAVGAMLGGQDHATCVEGHNRVEERRGLMRVARALAGGLGIDVPPETPPAELVTP